MFSIREVSGKAVALVVGGGFLVLVIAWIGLGIIMRMRETAGAVNDLNHLRLISAATKLYYDREAQFPPGTVPNAALKPDQRLSWLVYLLPYLEQDPAHQRTTPESALYERIRHDLAWNAGPNKEATTVMVKDYLCPAHPRDLPVIAPTYYVGLAGIGSTAALLPTDSPDAGVFGYDRTVRIPEITRGEMTLMATETARDIGHWARGGQATVRDLDPGQLPYAGPGQQFGGLFPDTFAILRVGGEATFVPNSIDPTVFSTMIRIHATPKDK